MKAVLYARYSPQPANTKTSKGKVIEVPSEKLEFQIEKCREYAKLFGYEVIEPPFTEAQKSGTRADVKYRPELEAAIQATIKNKAVLIAYTLFRISRNPVDMLKIGQRLYVNGCSLIVLDVRMDLTSEVGELIMTVLSGVGRFQARQQARLTSEAVNRLIGNGFRVGGECPYGMEPDPESAIVDTPKRGRMYAGMRENAEEQKVIARIMAMRGEGMSYSAIARELRDDGTMTRGVKWYSNSVYRIVKAQENNGANAPP